MMVGVDEVDADKDATGNEDDDIDAYDDDNDVGIWICCISLLEACIL